MNLAINARDAMPSGGQLRIKTANIPAIPGDPAQNGRNARVPCVELLVEDTGTGMDAKTLKHIFEPFFTTKDAGKGTGLGLSTVYGIVKQNGGWIRVKSEPGKGARFLIHLPAVEARQTGGVSTERTPGARENASVRGYETVLIVEDQPAVRAYIAECLRNSGYTVLEASSGKQALAVSRAHSETVHLLITDMVMPGMSGKDLAEALVRERAGLRVLVISGYTSDGMEATRLLAESDFQVLQKPISPSALTLAVRNILAAAGDPDSEPGRARSLTR
jgi:CheY-like chemotaxis protein